jgi:hypothetical protein
MRRRYEDYMSQVRRVLQTSDGLNPDEMLARMEKDGFGMRQTPAGEPDASDLAPAAEAPAETEVMTDAPSTDGPMETTSAPEETKTATPEPEAEPETATAVKPETTPEAAPEPELTPDEKLDGVLAQIDLGNEAFRCRR